MDKLNHIQHNVYNGYMQDILNLTASLHYNNNNSFGYINYFFFIDKSENFCFLYDNDCIAKKHLKENILIKDTVCVLGVIRIDYNHYTRKFEIPSNQTILPVLYFYVKQKQSTTVLNLMQFTKLGDCIYDWSQTGENVQNLETLENAENVENIEEFMID